MLIKQLSIFLENKKGRFTEIVKKFGAEDLKRFAKMHFKTASEAISEAEK